MTTTPHIQTQSAESLRAFADRLDRSALEKDALADEYANLQWVYSARGNVALTRTAANISQQHRNAARRARESAAACRKRADDIDAGTAKEAAPCA